MSKTKTSGPKAELLSFDTETVPGEEIPEANVENLMTDTLGGNGDDRAAAERILLRFVEEEWLVFKGPMP